MRVVLGLGVGAGGREGRGGGGGIFGDIALRYGWLGRQ